MRRDIGQQQALELRRNPARLMGYKAQQRVDIGQGPRDQRVGIVAGFNHLLQIAFGGSDHAEIVEQRQRKQAFGVFKCKAKRDPAAHRIAAEMALVDPQRVQKPPQSFGLSLYRVIGRNAAIVLAKTRQIGKNQPVILLDMRGVESPIVLVTAKAVNQHERLSCQIAAFQIGPGDVPDLDRLLHQTALAALRLDHKIEQDSRRQQIDQQHRQYRQSNQNEDNFHRLCFPIQPVTSAITLSRSGSLNIS